MGIVTSRDTRRISFDNTFALNSSALTVPKSVESDSVANFDDITSLSEPGGELAFGENTKYKETAEAVEIDYWTQRIENLKKEHQVINRIVETEYEKQIQNINETNEPPKFISNERLLKIKPCFDFRSKIIQCYEENSHQPLMCLPYVQAFTKCVASCRASD